MNMNYDDVLNSILTKKDITTEDVNKVRAYYRQTMDYAREKAGDVERRLRGVAEYADWEEMERMGEVLKSVAEEAKWALTRLETVKEMRDGRL